MAIFSASPKSLFGRKVLVVEDDYFIAQDICRSLEDKSAAVLGPVASVDDALALIASETRIDAAVLDINLLDVMVFPVADALKARDVPFVFATGYEKATVPDRFADVQHCEKPVDLEVLMRVFLP